MAFSQTFSTTIVSDDPNLPEFQIMWLRRDPNAASSSTPFENFGQSLSSSGQLEVIQTTNDLENLVGRLIHGTGGMWPPNVAEFVVEVCASAEIPVQSSPLNGVTLTGLLGAGGTASVIHLFQSGVTIQQAAVAVVFVGGSMIVLGAAAAVNRAVSEGLELWLKARFGGTPQSESAAERSRRRGGRATAPKHHEDLA